MGSRGTLILNGDTGLRSISSWFDLSKKEKLFKKSFNAKSQGVLPEVWVVSLLFGLCVYFFVLGCLFVFGFFFGGVV